jgi:hypothetical protein
MIGRSHRAHGRAVSGAWRAVQKIFWAGARLAYPVLCDRRSAWRRDHAYDAALG